MVDEDREKKKTYRSNRCCARRSVVICRCLERCMHARATHTYKTCTTVGPFMPQPGRLPW